MLSSESHICQLLTNTLKAHKRCNLQHFPGKLKKKTIFQVHYAVNINRSKSQWIDLGFHPEACVTQRYGCGMVGGAVSYWLRLRECGGIITTRSSRATSSISLATGFNIYCRTLDHITLVDNKHFKLLLDRN